MKTAKYDKGAQNGKNSSSQKNDSSFLPSHFEALKPFFLDSASQTEYENMVLKSSTSLLEFEKKFIPRRTQERVPSLKKASSIFSEEMKP
jgi:hypothetical protein